MKVLYVSYDGAMDPLGRAQVVPYVEGLAALGHQMTLLSFEKPGRLWSTPPRGVHWKPLRYHSGFSVATTSYDLARGFAAASALGPFDLVHARSYPGCLLAWWMYRVFATPYVFDVRGFYPEERVDGGLWPRGGALFRLTKRLERTFDRDAAAIVTLTQASIPIIEQRVAAAGGRAPVFFIPTCVDLERFQRSPGVREPVELVYSGSLGTWYLLDEMLAFCRVAQTIDDTCKVRFLTNDPPDAVRGLQRLTCLTVPFDRVPQAMEPASASFFFIQPAFSKIASAATKFGESLALGLPVVINGGVGDSERIVRQYKVGVVVEAFTTAAYEKAYMELRVLLREPDIHARCRQAAEAVFSLQRGVKKYAEIYASSSKRA